MTRQDEKKMNTLQRRRNQLTKLLMATKVNTAEVMTYQEHLEYEGLYAARTAVITQMNDLAEACCARTIASLRSRKQVMADFVKLQGGNQPA